MNNAITVIFPHQLFENNPCVDLSRTVHLIEDHLYFTQYPFHQQKLVLHRASMQRYRDNLKRKGFKTHYHQFIEFQDLRDLLQKWHQQGIRQLHYTETTDYLLEKRLKCFSVQFNIHLIQYPSPNFLTEKKDFALLLGTDKKYVMANFYLRQRKRLNILVMNKKPVGGKWSYDAENRKKMPSGIRIPPPFLPNENSYVKEAKEYVAQHFPKNPGDDKDFFYPISAEDATKVLEDFLENRLENYGIYQDAIVREQSILFHSLLTPALNIGLLNPEEIIRKTLEFHKRKKYPLNSLEGFLRQIIGWREFMRGVYELEGVFERTNNFWGFERKMPVAFYTGTTGIEPIDDCIKKLHRSAYCHHIERLMVLGSFMLLCEIHPDEVYRWFMEFFIDAYDWVMVPNVYGMSQYADGGLITTKPYICGSNYILKMSNYKRGDWCEIWDGLYWRFVHVNKKVFSSNPRMSMMARLVEKMPSAKLNSHIQVAETFLERLK